MHRIGLIALLMALVLTACGGSAADTIVAAPPNATPIERSDNQQINQYIERLRAEVPETMKAQSIKDTAEQPIQQQVYESTASLQEITDFYKTLTQQGWIQAAGMPLFQEGMLIDGYEHGSITLVIQAVEKAKFQEEGGVLIYTAKGTK